MAPPIGLTDTQADSTDGIQLRVETRHHRPIDMSSRAHRESRSVTALIQERRHWCRSHSVQLLLLSSPM